MAKVHEIEIDGIKAYAQRNKDAPTFCQWSITEKQTGYSLLPPSWPGSMSANTLENTIRIVQYEVIDKYGKETILKSIQTALAERTK